MVPPGLGNVTPAVAKYFCLALPAVFTQPGDHLLAEPCSVIPSTHCPKWDVPQALWDDKWDATMADGRMANGPLTPFVLPFIIAARAEKTRAKVRTETRL